MKLRKKILFLFLSLILILSLILSTSISSGISDLEDNQGVDITTTEIAIGLMIGGLLIFIFLYRNIYFIFILLVITLLIVIWSGLI